MKGSVDFCVLDVPFGSTFIDVIPRFTWPDTGNATMQGLLFYGAMLNQDMTAILGDYAVVEWGFGSI